MVSIMVDQGPLMSDWMSHGVGRRMFTTKSGYLGMAGPRVAVGDLVAIIQGSKVPVVLRHKGEGEKWEFVGDAYVHGVMKGEAVAGRGTEDWVEFLVE
jgi:hypothetical protein